MRWLLTSRVRSSSRADPRDCDANGVRADRQRPDGTGMVLSDFVGHPNAHTAALTEAELVALRLYSTAAFTALNRPLRDAARTSAHPLAATVVLLTSAIKKLRAVDTENRELDLWRGMRNLAATTDFDAHGGTERAPMSTTTDPKVAVRYALGHHSLLFKVRASSFMNRGCDITWCSAFPSEREYVYPPLTYLLPTGRKEHVEVVAESDADGQDAVRTVIDVVEVEPHVV